MSIQATWDGKRAQNGMEVVHVQTMEDSLRRPAAKIAVMSDEEWDKMVEEARQRRVARQQAEEQQEKQEMRAAYKKAIFLERIKQFENQLVGDIRRDNSHLRFYQRFLQHFHEPNTENEFSENTWKETYDRLGCFLVKIDATYDWSERGVGTLSQRLNSQGRGWSCTSDDDLHYFAELVNRKQKGTQKKVGTCSFGGEIPK